MNLWDKITGHDMTKEYKGFEARAKHLPIEFQVAWERIKGNLWQHSDFTGRNLMPILENVLEMLEESAANGQCVEDILDEDLTEFCTALVGTDGANSFRDKWRKQLNHNIAKKLGK